MGYERELYYVQGLLNVQDMYERNECIRIWSLGLRKDGYKRIPKAFTRVSRRASSLERIEMRSIQHVLLYLYSALLIEWLWPCCYRRLLVNQTEQMLRWLIDSLPVQIQVNAVRVSVSSERQRAD